MSCDTDIVIACEKESEPIIGRFIPDVKGIDLEHSLNYTKADGIGLEWFYECFTYPKTFYQKGSRPFLEGIVDKYVEANTSDSEKIDQIIKYLDKNLPHPVHLAPDNTVDLLISYPSDRGASEEEILASSYGWCNEQSRVFLALTQIAGIPSRMLFGALPERTGHVLSEVYADGKWGIVDQSTSYVFRDVNGAPVNVLDLKNDQTLLAEITVKYRQAILKDSGRALDKSPFTEGKGFLGISRPTELFYRVGYCNYFIH